MAVLLASRTAQRVMSARFTFNHSDTMLDVDGDSADFGLTNIAATSFDIINLPPGAVVIGGSLHVETAFDTASYAVIIGDVDDPDRYLATADRKAAALTALVPTGYVTTGQNIRIEITNADVCTTGKAHVRVDYIIVNRAEDVNPA